MMIIGSGGRPVHNLPSPALDSTLVTPPVLSRYQEKKVLQKMEQFLFYSYSSYLKVSHSLMIGGVLNTDENQRQDYYVTDIYGAVVQPRTKSPSWGLFFSCQAMHQCVPRDAFHGTPVLSSPDTPTPLRENQNFTKYVYFNSRVKTQSHPAAMLQILLKTFKIDRKYTLVEYFNILVEKYYHHKRHH